MSPLINPPEQVIQDMKRLKQSQLTHEHVEQLILNASTHAKRQGYSEGFAAGAEKGRREIADLARKAAYGE